MEFDSAGALRFFVDLAISSFLLYRVIVMIKGTKSQSIAITLVVLLVGTSVVRNLNLTVTSWLLEQFWLAGLLLLAVSFQPEIRKTIMEIRHHPAMAKILLLGEKSPFQEISSAIGVLSRKKWGHVLVLERRDQLAQLASSGVPLQLKATRELLVALAHPSSPLSQGAVLVSQDGHIVAARCPFGIGGASLAGSYEAAAQLTKQRDCAVIITAAQTGQISLIIQGRHEPIAHSIDLLRRFKNLPASLIGQTPAASENISTKAKTYV